MWNILFLLFTLSSVITIPNIADNFWIPKNAVFLILGFILLGYNFISSDNRTLIFKNKWIGLILIYLVLSFGWYFYWPVLMAKAGQRVFWNVWNFLPSLSVILTVFLIKDLVEYTDSLKRWVTMAKFLCWLCFGFSVYSILQYLGLDQIFGKDLKWSNPNHMITFMGNSMQSANFIAMLAPLCLMFKDLKYKIFYALAFITLILANSTISMAAFLISFLVYLVWMKRIKTAAYVVLLILGLAYIIYLYRPAYFSFSGRLELWRIVLSGWKARAFTGWGLGSFAIKKYADHTSSIAVFATNEYIQILHDGGIILLVLVGGYLLNLFKRIILAKDSILVTGYTVSLISFLILGLGSSILWLSPLALAVTIYISALETQV